MSGTKRGWNNGAWNHVGEKAAVCCCVFCGLVHGCKAVQCRIVPYLADATM